MRRSVLLLTPLLPLVLVACEDGPNQTFSPASGTLFNNGDSPAITDDAGNPFNSTFGGSTKQEICTGDELQRQWGKMINQPVKPPRFMAGVDIAGGDKYPGLTVEQAELGPTSPVAGVNPDDAPTRLCQPTVLGAGGNGGDVGGSIVVAWGNNGEFQMEWAVPTHKAYLVTLATGYNGKMEWSYLDPKTNKTSSYVWQLGQIIQKDGSDFMIAWDTTGASPACKAGTCHDQVDELYQGIVGAFAPELIQKGVACWDSTSCAVFPTGNDGIHPVIGFRPAAFYMETFNPFTSKEAGSRMWQAYLFNIKFSPYSYARTTLKSDAIGPTATLEVGDNGKICNLGLGDSFDSLMNNCIQVFKDSNTNTQSLNKVMGNLTHDDQNFTFSVVGVNQNYHNTALDVGGTRQFDVIHDNETPADDPKHNIADDFTFDVRSGGPILNDQFAKTANGKTSYPKDYHGSGAVQSEWGRMVQADLAAAYHKDHPNVPLRTWHDSQCYFPMECTGGAACTGLSGDDCLGTTGCNWGLPAVNTCRPQVQTPANAAACAAHDAAGATDGGASCKADTAHACAWWDGPNSWRPAAGCTGFEGLITDMSPSSTSTEDPLFQLAGGIGGQFPFRPGNPAASFCADPGVYNFCGFSGDLAGLSADVWGASLQRVTQFLGKGNVLDVPLEGRDLRFYFKKYLISYAKYMTGPAALAAGPNASPAVEVPDFSNQKVDLDYLIFDSYGGGAARGEYIDFNHAGEPDPHNSNKPQDPISIELKTLLIGSNTQSTSFFRRLDREERVLFEAFAIDNTKPAWAYLPGVTDSYPNAGYGMVNARMFLSSMFGSSALASMGYADVTDANGNIKAITAADPDPNYKDPCIPGNPAVKSAHYCATHSDTDCSLMAPADDLGNIYLRENNKPLLEGYCGAFATTAFQLGQHKGFEINDIPGESPNLFTQTVRVKVNDFENPYDLSSKKTQIEVAVPWKPKQEGVGFPVANPASPMQDVFVETSQLDFTGQVMTPVVDFDDKCCYLQPPTDDGGAPTEVCDEIPDPAGQCNADPSGKPRTHKAEIQAIETEDFLGDVFLCVDQISAANRVGTGHPGDILSAHMYTSVTTILDWIASHPGAQDACQIVIRYSPFNNYPDYVQATSTGVRLSIDQSAGYGRVSDVTIFQPGLGTPAAP